MPLLSPTNHRPLAEASAGTEVGGLSVPEGLPPDAALLSDGERLWPVVDDIAFLRPGEDLRAAAAQQLSEGRVDGALRLLLADQDRFAPTPPPSPASLDRLLADDPRRGGRAALDLRDAMRLLSYGPVGDYFAYRWMSPTYLSGLVLLGRAAQDDRPVLEVACGIGHYLRALEQFGFEVAGVDIVFSKLYLARRFLGVRGRLVCGDVERGTVLAPADDQSRTVFCHDAFYFFERKRAALEHMRALAGPDGALAVGHVHTRGDAHEAGFSESVDDYRARLSEQATLLDDAALPAVWYGTADYPAVTASPAAQAVAWTEGRLRDEPLDWSRLARLAPEGLRQNPLLTPDGVAWPSPGWRAEYEADASAAELGPYHLEALAARPVAEFAHAVGTSRPTSPRQTPPQRLRDRLLVNLPERW